MTRLLLYLRLLEAFRMAAYEPGTLVLGLRPGNAMMGRFLIAL